VANKCKEAVDTFEEQTLGAVGTRLTCGFVRLSDDEVLWSGARLSQVLDGDPDELSRRLDGDLSDVALEC